MGDISSIRIGSKGISDSKLGGFNSTIAGYASVLDTWFGLESSLINTYAVTPVVIRYLEGYPDTSLELLLNTIKNFKNNNLYIINMGLADTLVERSQIIDLDNKGITCSPTNNDLYKEVYDLMVGENNQFAKKYYQLENTLKAIKKPLVITEGKTDIKFIQKAKEVLGLNDVIFDIITPEQQPDGYSNLQKMLEQLCKIKRPFPIIGIFDRDIDDIVKKVDIGDDKYKNYGNKVYAFCIPIPKVREDSGQTKISIEYLFSDEEIKSPVDEVGHRLFFGTEFTKHSMVHNESPNLTLSKPDGKGIDKILENNGGQAVYDENDNNILAKKNDFANAVISGNIKISDDSWENFRIILEKIKKLSEI